MGILVGLYYLIDYSTIVNYGSYLLYLVRHENLPIYLADPKP